jgi:hypothetical protein
VDDTPGVDDTRAPAPLALPPYVQALLADQDALGRRLAIAGQFAEAFDAYRRAYEVILSAQPPHGRFHKGLALHNMGWVRIRAGATEDGARWTMLGFIEDSLSRAAEQPGLLDELSRPAASNLLLLGVSVSELSGLARRIRSAVSEGRLVRDPLELYIEFELDFRVRIGRVAEPTAIRVLVSSPGDTTTERRMVAEVCRELSMTLGCHVEALLWEGAGRRNPECQGFPPEVSGASPQEVVDDHVFERLGGYHVYLGTIWRRMGTPTLGWRSGTEAEYRTARARRQATGEPADILFYVKNPGRGQAEPDAAEFVRELKSSQGLIHKPFRGAEDLRRKVFSDLLAIVRMRVKQAPGE